MNDNGIGNELLETIRRMRWETLLFMNLDVHKDLVYEFYSSLSMPMDENINIIGYIISFRTRGEDHMVEPEKFVEWLNCENKGILNTLRH